MKFKAVLFDLDMTLLDTSSIRQQRENLEWSYVFEHMNEVKPFSKFLPNPHKLPEILSSEGYKIGIVTSSDGNYAKILLEKYSIFYDLLVSYQDTNNHKPDPEPILFASKQLNLSPEECIYIGDERTDYIASSRAGCSCIGAGWGMINEVDVIGYAPDFLINDPKLLVNFSQIPFLEYLLEDSFSTIDTKFVHDGSILTWIDNGIRYHALGRYFNVTDTRHKQSTLSKSLIQFRENPAKSDYFAAGIQKFIKSDREFDQPYIVTCVPPIPGQTNRFMKLFQILEEQNRGSALQFFPNGLINLGLTCNREIMGCHARVDLENNHIETIGKFPENVLLINDILFSGKAAKRCIMGLMKSGSKKIQVLSLAKSQFKYSLERNRKCPECRGELKIKQNMLDGSLYWRCSSFPDCFYYENIGY